MNILFSTFYSLPLSNFMEVLPWHGGFMAQIKAWYERSHFAVKETEAQTGTMLLNGVVRTQLKDDRLLKALMSLGTY